MLFFLLPLLFNPLSFTINWLPSLYLSIWPIIIQTLGRESLVNHALVLTLFILTCDITRQTMLKLVSQYERVHCSHHNLVARSTNRLVSSNNRLDSISYHCPWALDSWRC